MGMPTGRTARLTGESAKDLHEHLALTRAAAAEKDCDMVLLDQDEGTVLRGAATCSLVELQTAQMLGELKHVLQDAFSLQSLSEPQLETIFDKLDLKGKGVLDAEELQAGLELLGLTRSMDSLLSEL